MCVCVCVCVHACQRAEVACAHERGAYQPLARSTPLNHDSATLCAGAGKTTATLAAAAERRPVADGLCCLTVSALTRFYHRPVPALPLPGLGWGSVALRHLRVPLH